MFTIEGQDSIFEANRNIKDVDLESLIPTDINKTKNKGSS